MDFFKFVPGADPSYLTDGEAINGIKTAMWAERYTELGEFEFRAKESSLLNLKLPVGTIVSHVASEEPMMVNRIELDDDVKDSENEWVITGNSLESYFKHRIIGDDIETYVIGGDRLYVNMDTYTLAFDTSWAQTVQMIKDHLKTNFNIPNDNLNGWDIISNEQHTVVSPITVPRTIKPQTLYAAMQELLAIDDFGIKVVRPNAGNVDPTKTEFRIHNGLDLRNTVIFSHAFGDLEKTKYFWSDEALKTEYYCISTYYRLRSDDGVAGFPRRVLLVDCTDLDAHLSDTEVVDGPTADDIGSSMDIRGKQALRAWNSSAIITTNISRTTQYKYRTDYKVGDIVSVRANYGAEAVKRVTEYVEFQDENGESGYPTLSALNE